MVKPNPNRKINKIQSYPFSNSDLQFKILTVRLTKSRALQYSRPGFESYRSHFVALCPWEICSINLCLIFLFCKMRVIMVPQVIVNVK